MSELKEVIDQLHELERLYTEIVSRKYFNSPALHPHGTIVRESASESEMPAECNAALGIKDLTKPVPENQNAAKRKWANSIDLQQRRGTLAIR